jgi:hypothetical protein
MQLLKEAVDPTKPKTMKFRGIFMQSEKRNGNNRIYPYSALKPEVDRFIEEMVNTGRALQELEHPESSEIDPTRACARILSLEEDNKQWIGEAVILCSDEKFGIKGTLCGDTLAALAQYGTTFGVSSRAMGNVDEDGVVSDLKLVTADVVMNPSIGEFVSTNGNRFVNGILESKRWLVDNHGLLVECKIEDLEKRIAKMPNTSISSKKNKFLVDAAMDFMKSLCNS